MIGTVNFKALGNPKEDLVVADADADRFVREVGGWAGGRLACSSRRGYGYCWKNQIEVGLVILSHR